MSSSTEVSFPQIVELNVGGNLYSTTRATLTRERDSLLGLMFTGRSKEGVTKDSQGRYFIDRDGSLFRYVLDYLRSPQQFVLPEAFMERERLAVEAEYFRLPNMTTLATSTPVVRTTKPACLPPVGTENNNSSNSCQLSDSGRKPNCITIGYRGTFAFGRDGLADVKFRKLSRLLISGRVSACRDVFGDTLNESRDPDRGTDDRYTSRFFLKHNSIEQAFDRLLEHGYRLAGCCGTSTNSTGELKPGMDTEESRWNHYNEFVFFRY